MYRAQRGCFPYILNLIAAGFLMYSFIGSVYIVSTFIDEAKQSQSLPGWTQTQLIHLVSSLLPYTLLLIFVLFFSGLLPAVRITKKGIRYRALGMFSGLIKWEEVEEVIDLKRPKNYKAISISRPGPFVLNGLWFQALYGILFTNYPDPIILLSPGMEEREKLIEEIQKYISK